MATAGRLVVALEANAEGFRRQLDRAEKNLSSATAKMNRNLAAMEQRSRAVQRSFSKAFAGIAAAVGGGQLVGGIIQTNRNFQKLEASLITVTGSADKAEAAFNKIKEFASTTPFSVQEATEAFVKLKLLGLDPSEKALQSYGNTASATGKSLNQFIEAVADAATGEFERLKEFGIKTRSEGEKVTLTFQGQSRTINKTAEDISKALQDIGNIQFAGATDRQAKTLNGAFSNLGDAVDRFSVRVGDAGFNKALADMAVKFKGIFDEAGPLADVIGKVLSFAVREFTKLLEGMVETSKLVIRFLQGMATVAAQAANAVATAVDKAFKKTVGFFDKVFKALPDIPADNPFAKRMAEVAGSSEVAAATAARAAKAIKEVQTVVGSSTNDNVNRAAFGTAGGGATSQAAQKAAQEAQRRAEAIQNVVQNLKFETEQLRRSNVEQQVYNNLKQANVSINSEAGKRIADLTRAFENETTAIEKSRDRFRKWEATMVEGQQVTERFLTTSERNAKERQRFNRLFLEGAIDAETYRRAIEDLESPFVKLKDIGQALGSAVTSSFADMIKGTEKLTDALGNVLDRMAEIALQTLVLSPFENAFASGLQNLIPFARGGIVTSPTPALIGEAGPEAVIPLNRLPDLRGTASNNNQPIINITNNSSAQIRQQPSADNRQLEFFIEDAVASNIARGGGVARAIDSRFSVGRNLRG